MNEQKLIQFKKKHGGYSPRDLVIHMRGYLLGFLSGFLIIDYILLLMLIFGVIKI